MSTAYHEKMVKEAEAKKESERLDKEHREREEGEQMQNELEPIIHSHPTEHDESDDLEMVKAIKEKGKNNAVS
ncbi:MAG: hypothetical protein MK299_10385 [Pseudomonadales bacterium]|nr:hypothetical protein [Pseudomonadales bacterium]